jgi:hypothetical protein
MIKDRDKFCSTIRQNGLLRLWVLKKKSDCGAAYRCNHLLHDLLVCLGQHNNTSAPLTLIGECQLLNDSQALVVPAEHKRVIAANKV